jgi:hypothetical protein
MNGYEMSSVLDPVDESNSTHRFLMLKKLTKYEGTKHPSFENFYLTILLYQ